MNMFSTYLQHTVNKLQMLFNMHEFHKLWVHIRDLSTSDINNIILILQIELFQSWSGLRRTSTSSPSWISKILVTIPDLCFSSTNAMTKTRISATTKRRERGAQSSRTVRTSTSGGALIMTTGSKRYRRIETNETVPFWTCNFSNKNIPSSRYQKRDITIGFSGTDLAGNNVLDIPKRFKNRGFRSSDVICSVFLRLLRSWIVFLCREILTRFYSFTV